MRLPSSAGVDVRATVMGRSGQQGQGFCPSALHRTLEVPGPAPSTPPQKCSAFLRFPRGQLWGPPSVEVRSKKHKATPLLWTVRVSGCGALGTKWSCAACMGSSSAWPKSSQIHPSGREPPFHKHTQSLLPITDAHRRENPEPHKAGNPRPRCFGYMIYAAA